MNRQINVLVELGKMTGIFKDLGDSFLKIFVDDLILS